MKTATIERYHVWGTPNHCVALWYRGEELTPLEDGSTVRRQWIPDDVQGVERLRQVAINLGFTHVRYTGEWGRKHPKKQKLLAPRGMTEELQ